MLLDTSPERQRQRALHRVATEDTFEMTAKARTAAFQRWCLLVDPSGRLPLPERERRAVAARRIHMLGLAAEAVRIKRERRAAAAA